MRSQACSSIATRAWWIVGWEATKCRASTRPNPSGESMPCSRANAKTVFFCVSVASTAELSPVQVDRLHVAGERDARPSGP